MPRKESKTKAAAGLGTIRKKEVTRNGKQYTYWEARYTAGFDPGTGKQIQRSITGKSQKIVAQRLKDATHSLDEGTYIAPSKMTVGEWLDIWSREYLGGIKQSTASTYEDKIRLYLKPNLGALRLDTLAPHVIQSLYNKQSESGLSPKTVKNTHTILHKALKQAQACGYIRMNPCDACILPRIIKKTLSPLDEVETKIFLKEIQGHRFEVLFTVTIFTGLRLGEVLGLMWNCVNFASGTILIDKQLQMKKKSGGQYELVTTKNSKGRVISVAPWVMQLLKEHREKQIEQRIEAGSLWQNSKLVFTNKVGEHLHIRTVNKAFKKIVTKIGRPDARFHDLRHSYAVAAIRAGDDIKTVQGNLGHATAAFTLDVYGHITDQMRAASAQRMDSYIKDILCL